MTVAIAALYAAVLVEVFTAARVGVNVLVPKQPATRGVHYSGALLRHMAHDRYVREMARTRND
ncbi:hypothetical protein ABZ938_06050 [Streptomyces sp. NPDC046409]|uniref:hypothetical protein n=1 Tax=Streptomyces sp. NPDC046409 TaxID=3156675 RepID=UPI0033E06F48